jgi:hypothetical protein
MKVKERKYKGWFRFWIKSNRGTDQQGWKFFDIPLTKAEIKCHLEQWCSEFGCWRISENMVDYGFDRKWPPVHVIESHLEAAKRHQSDAIKRIKLMEKELAKRSK